MSCKVIQCCVLLLCFIEVLSICRQGPYPNLCGNEYNATVNEDVEMLCDCQKASFCFIINFTQECDSAIVQLDINENEALLTPLHCNILPLESQAAVPILQLLNSTAGTFSVKFSDDSHKGMYIVSCALPELCENGTSSTEWKIVDISPMEVFVDSEVKLQLTFAKDEDMHINSTPAWCFINTPDNDTEVVLAVLTSEGQITCAGFIPAVPGAFTISLGSGFPPNTFEKSISIKSIAKHPAAQQVEYGSDFETVFIHFDANIELHSSCKDTFPTLFAEFGTELDCFAGGNTLKVKLASRLKIINNITIAAGNKICHEGSFNAGFCLAAQPANLLIAKPKVSGPSLSFYMTDACGGKKAQNYVSVRVINSNRTALAPQNQTFQGDSAGKTQRKNLILWKIMRQFQNKLSSRVVLQLNKTDMLPLFENLSALDNVLDVDDNNLGSGASVSVHVQSSPSSSSLWAEAQVSFCNDSVRLFRYKWLFNGRMLSEEGRLLTLGSLPPGKYLLKCLVVAYDSSEVLGQGWATGEVVENAEEVVVVPKEVTVGTTDSIFLRAVTKNGNSVTWACRTASGGICVTRDEKLLSSVHDLRSLSLSLPAESLPVGEYIWTAESFGKSDTAKVFVKAAAMSVSVKMSSIFVNTFLGFVLNGSVRRTQGTCRIKWTSVRHKGFSYLDLRSVGIKEISVEEPLPQVDVTLAIPPSSRNSGALQPHSLYLFKLEAFCPRTGSLSYIKVPVHTSVPPTASSVAVKPLAGEAMITRFQISGADADTAVPSYPLMFEWSYVDPCGLEIPLGHGLSSRNFTTYLPPGDVKIMARVCDEKRICSTSVSATVVVTQAPEILQENFEKSIIEVEYLMSSGDDSEAFGVAVTALRSLALTAEFEIREKILSAVEKAVDFRIKMLSDKLAVDPHAVELCLKFCERSETVAKYFRKGSAMLRRLTDFRNSLSKYPKFQ